MRRRAGRFGLEIILVNVWEGQVAWEESRRFCELWGIEGCVLIDERDELVRALGVTGVPTNVFVDADGTITDFGASRPAAIERAVRRLLPGADLGEPAGGRGSSHWQTESAHIERHVTAHNNGSPPTDRAS